MRKSLLSIIYHLLSILFLLPTAMQAQTLEECWQAAERNYPLIKQYGLISQSTEKTVANIGKGWLPQVGVTAQATYQSDVVSLTQASPLTPLQGERGTQVGGIYNLLGGNGDFGLKKDQYKVGIDVNQTVYDGGAISSQKEVARRQGAVEEAETEVSMYQVHKRVNELYFALLLTDEQIRLNDDLQRLLEGNEKKLQSMFRQGTAAESDYNSVRAERLKVVQQAGDLQSQRQRLTLLLNTLCGMEVKSPVKPEPVETSTRGYRPELKLADAQLAKADAQERTLTAALMPRLSVFASGYYGYPGYNMFEDMMSHRWSWNGIVGARLSWNIGALYTHRNDKAKIQLQRGMIETGREVFLFNNNMERIQQSAEIERYRRLMRSDDEIIDLRASVRKAAESKLAHGIIDVNDLVKEINSENGARVQKSMHEIEMLKEMYDMKE